MQCPRCQQDNPPQARFCMKCGASVTLACGKCGTELPASAAFCFSCGQPIETTRAREPRFTAPEAYTPKHLAERILTSKAALEGERKHVTVLFADVKGSMELLADRDPEEASKILDPVLELMMEAVHRYEGTVNQVMGDGIMALFGAPLAHEDHAVRACYTALRMQEAVKRYAECVRRNTGIPVQIRIGLNSGEVVVRSIGSDLHMDYTAVGQTTHLAARMEQMALPETILLAPDTLTLAEGFVQATPLGPMPVKGLGEPVEVFELTGAGAARTRLEAAARRGLTGFVGRTAELEQLRDALDRAGQGHGQVAAVVGEPGVGKSRLFWELIHSHRVHGWLIVQSASVSYGKATAYLPVTELLRGYFEIESRDDPRKIREKVTGKVLTLAPALAPSVPAFLALLDVPVDEASWQTLDPPQQRQQTLDAVKGLLLRESEVQPLVVVFEDLHWIDGETQTLLDSLVESLPAARLLLLVNYRPEYQHAWGGKTYYRQLQIDPLSPESADELLDALLGTDAALNPLKQLLVQRTEANPLFLEESVRALVETGALASERGGYRLTRAVEQVKIPATVQAILAARIDRLAPDAKQLLQAAAVIGKDVPMPLLLAIADAPEPEVRAELTRLQAAEFLYETRLFPDLEYTFKHALTHEVAYQGLLHERQRALHARITEAIERLQPRRLVEDVDRLAQHAFRGEVWDRAVRYSRQAGGKAQQRSAHREAVAWLEQALAALAHLPTDVDRLGQAIDLRLELRGSLYAIGEFERMHAHLLEAEGLAEQLGEARRQGWVSMHLGEYNRQVGHFRKASALIERAHEIAGTIDDVPLRLAADQYLGMALHALGDYRRAAEHERRAAEFPREEPAPDGFGPTQTGSPAGFRAVSLSWLARCLAEIGEFDEGIESGRQAIRLAEEIDRAYALVSACWALGYLYRVRGELEPATLLLDRALTSARGAGLTRLLPQVMRALGSAYALMGRVAAGTALLEEAVTLSESINLQVAESSSLVLLGEAHLLAGRVDDAHVAGTRALAMARRRGQRGDEASALRLLGDIATHLDPVDVEGVPQLQAATGLAEKLSLRPLVAHCHLSLGKLYRRMGKRQKAQEHLNAATTMYREMGMHFWLEQAEAEMRGLTQ